MSSINRKRTLKSDLADLDLIIDKGCGDVEIVNKRANVVRSLQELENLQSLEAAQKSKIKWAIEGDENSKAVWDCGTDKSPGPDGFTFGFYRRYWNILESDVVDVVTSFFHHGQFPKGSNSSFIALIPKTRDANMVKDFRPISLIGSMYKIIAKILANRLVLVLGDLVNEVQSAFIADRQILDGPFILNKFFNVSNRKRSIFCFKVDFEKAFDSVRWDYLDDILRRFDFGEKWCSWIQSCLRSSRGSVIVNGSPTEEFQFPSKVFVSTMSKSKLRGFIGADKLSTKQLGFHFRREPSESEARSFDSEGDGGKEISPSASTRKLIDEFSVIIWSLPPLALRWFKAVPI
ncbi:RNA-directed DNA polymerase, eukaryota, reverse transcriptase zinc-binding domain protein [Tanacetum coccineum]